MRARGDLALVLCRAKDKQRERAKNERGPHGCKQHIHQLTES